MAGIGTLLVDGETEFRMMRLLRKSHIFSGNLSGDAHARIDLDERRELAIRSAASRGR